LGLDIGACDGKCDCQRDAAIQRGAKQPHERSLHNSTCIIAALAGEKTQQELNKQIHPAYSFIALLS
jgi:hypothetical protein